MKASRRGISLFCLMLGLFVTVEQRAKAGALADICRALCALGGQICNDEVDQQVADPYLNLLGHLACDVGTEACGSNCPN